MHLHRTAVAVLAAVALVVTATPANAATADKPGVAGDPVIQAYIKQVGRQFLDNQDALDAFRTWIGAQPGVVDAGYVESVHFAEARSVTLLWSGDPAAAEPLIQEGARRGIAVKVEQRQYGLKEIQSAIDETWAAEGRGEWAGFQISYIAGVSADYDGIVVHGAYVNPLRSLTPATDLAHTASVTAGLPVRVVDGNVAVDDATRSNDYAPFNAGGYMHNTSTGHTCSSGFAIWISGVRHITTARHCNENYVARNGSASYGTSVRTSGDGAARVLSATGVGLMFDGAWNNSAGYTKNVDSLADVGLNDSVCVSGGNSGVHCGIKIDNMRVSHNDGSGSFSNIHGTQQNSGQIASIQGDSGGPVFTLAGTGRVHAVGMDQAHDKEVSNCGSVHDAGSNRCGRGILFTSMRTIINSIPGASIVTS